jgi:long-subunit acyl-CoA synthetase (AMP-forming)
MLKYRSIDGIKSVLSEPDNALGIRHDGNNNFVSYLPLNHIFERVVVEWVCFTYGGSISFVESIDTFGKNLKEIQPHVFAGAPRVWTKLQLGILSKFPQKRLDFLLSIPLLSSILKKLIRKGLGFSRIRQTVSGAAPIQVSLIEWFRKIGIYITNGYGMTENCVICTAVDGQNIEKTGSVGITHKGIDLKIDEETGEILTKGPVIMSGYYKNKDMSDRTLRNGWLHTGDKGYLDSDGYLYITGRVTDSFKTSKGKFIEPVVLEELLGDINEIEESCVVGRGIAQPLCLIQLSDIGKSISRDKLSNILLERMNSINAKLMNYQKLSTFIIVKDEWTQENGIIGPTQKLKRGEIEDVYSNKYLKWHESVDKIIFE